MASKAFEWLDIGVCWDKRISSNEGLSVPELERLRVKICLSRCSSLVKDWPQYVQNTILARWGRDKTANSEKDTDVMMDGSNFLCLGANCLYGA